MTPVEVDCVVPTHGRPHYLAEALAFTRLNLAAPAEVDTSAFLR